MSDLLSCPFCANGNEAELRTDYSERYAYSVECVWCGAKTGQYRCADEAIQAWNTRAERTCHADLNAGRNAVVCSECGSSMLLGCWEEFTDWGGNVLIDTFKTYPYCPNCGSRVLEET